MLEQVSLILEIEATGAEDGERSGPPHKALDGVVACQDEEGGGDTGGDAADETADVDWHVFWGWEIVWGGMCWFGEMLLFVVGLVGIAGLGLGGMDDGWMDDWMDGWLDG
jgi:hypothetical protein